MNTPQNNGDTACVVEVSDVTFGYPPLGIEQPVLEEVSLTIEPRDFLGIIGPNGGGKTTLLKLMLGLLRPQKGAIRIMGRPPSRVRHRIGYVPQHASVDASVPADVLDIVLTGRLAGSSWGAWFGRADVEAAMAALKRVHIAELARRPLRTLSGGQRQRVLIARALVCQPQLLLLDEPTANVDAHVEAGLTDLLHELNHSLAIVMVSHDVSFVSTHLKRVACLNRRISVQRASDISPDIIARMYGGDVRHIHHGGACPLTDPGCEQDCEPAETAAADAAVTGTGRKGPPPPPPGSER